jgi:hypothetical protein
MANTNCHISYGPCVSNGNDTVKPLPTKDDPVVCDDSDFSFYVLDYTNIAGYTLHVSHTYKDGAKWGTHSGQTKKINRDNYPNGYVYNCGASGVCSAYFQNVLDPIVVPFEQDCGTPL